MHREHDATLFRKLSQAARDAPELRVVVQSVSDAQSRKPPPLLALPGRGKASAA